VFQTLYLKSVHSTQSYLKNLVKSGEVKLPYAVLADIQTDGIGSRDNTWTGLEGNFFLSFGVSIDSLPDDLKLESSSIYFSYILKDVLSNLNSSVWIKWPNDFYIDNCKIGGMITNVVGNNLICGVGLNLLQAPKGFSSLDIVINREKLLKIYLQNIEKKVPWKQVFSKYKLEFHRNKNFSTHNNNNEIISLENVELQNDGSIISNGKRMYSLR